MPESVTHVRVRYSETDQMGIVYHANYLVWMEIGRVEACRAAGFHYRDMEQNDGILLAVTEVDCRYLFPARYDDEVAIHTRILNATRRRVVFAYEMFAGGKKLATGETKHIYLNRELRPTRLPAKYAPLFGIVTGEEA